MHPLIMLHLNTELMSSNLISIVIVTVSADPAPRLNIRSQTAHCPQLMVIVCGTPSNRSTQNALYLQLIVTAYGTPSIAPRLNCQLKWGLVKYGGEPVIYLIANKAVSCSPYIELPSRLTSSDTL